MAKADAAAAVNGAKFAELEGPEILGMLKSS